MCIRDRTGIIKRNYYVEIVIENYRLTFRDGANIRYYQKPTKLKKSKLLITFADQSFINVTTVSYTHLDVYKRQR